MTLKEFLPYARKFITAVIGVAALGITQGLIEGTAAKWVAIVISAATALGVYVVPNAPLEKPSVDSTPPSSS
jgi:hypothetical protein